MTSQEDLKKLIRHHSHRLQILKERQALQGLETPPSVIIQIEDIEGKLESLQDILASGETPIPADLLFEIQIVEE